MKKKDFNRGMYKFMNKGYSKQSAFNKMKGLTKKNNSKKQEINFQKIHPFGKYLGALILELILIFYKVTSKEGIQISLIQTIIPLSSATQPLMPFITIIAILLQIYPIYVLYNLVKRIIS